MMNRRNFLKNGSAAGLVATTLGFVACQSPGKPGNEAAGNQTGPAADDFELNEITIDELQQKMQSGAYTARAITELYLKRIDAIDNKGHALNAVIEINPDALAIADAMDSERKAGKVRGPLH